MKSADTQDSNVLGGGPPAMTPGAAPVVDEDVDLPPSYTSKSATTLPLDSRAADEDLALDDDEMRDWQSPQPGHDEPVQSIEFAEDSEDDVVDEFGDYPLAHSDMVRWRTPTWRRPGPASWLR